MAGTAQPELAEGLRTHARRSTAPDPSWRSSSSKAARRCRGTVVPAGNKNAALPDPRRVAADGRGGRPAQRAAHPRRRGDARAARATSACKVEWRDEQRGRASRPTRSRSTEVDADLAERIRASFLLAGPLLARFGRALHAAARRRRDRPPPARPAPRRVPRARGRRRTSTRDIRLRAPDGGLRAGDVFMDEPSVMATENALMAAALTPGHDRHRQRRLRAARPGPRADADADGRRDRGHRLERPASSTAWTSSAAASTRSRPTTSRSARSWRSPACTGGELRITGLRPRRPADDPARLRAASACAPSSTATTSSSPATRSCVVARDVGEYKSKVQDGPVAGVPGRPHVDRGRAGHAGRGLDPDPRVDVREPPDLHRQAGLDGRGHHALRSAPRDRHRPAPAARRARRVARTSGRAWRCSSRRCAPRATSEIGNIRQIDRGYERIDERLRELGRAHRARRSRSVWQA